MIDTPRGRRSSDPLPLAITSGTAPKMAAKVVIMIGRNRIKLALQIASYELNPHVASFSSLERLSG